MGLLGSASHLQGRPDTHYHNLPKRSPKTLQALLFHTTPQTKFLRIATSVVQISFLHYKIGEDLPGVTFLTR